MNLRIITIDFKNHSERTEQAVDRLDIFSGNIYLIKNLPPLTDFFHHLKDQLNRELKCNPQLIHEHLTVADFNRIKMEMNARFKLEEKNKFFDHYRDVVEALNWDARGVNFDQPIIRLNPPQNFSLENEGGEGVIPMRSFTKIHRDTWGVNIMSQVNWWMPLYPVTKQNSFAIYPDYWNRELPNTTASWSFTEYLKKKDEGYPLMPIATEEPDESNALKLTPEPGELLLFSAAHLHGTIPNTSRFTRVNFETRCYFDSDFESNIGAPNVDTLGAKPVTRLFTKIQS